MTKRRRSFLVLGSTIAGVCLSVGFLPSLFEFLPNELARTKNLLHAVHGATEPLPEIVVLGNSIAMNGVDAKRLSNDLTGSPVVWNLSSTGQLLIESTLIADELPETVNAVLLTVFTNDLVKEASEVPKSKLIAYLQYGYQPSKPTLNTILKFGSPEVVDIFTKSKWQIALDSRWAIRSAIDISGRSLLRKDLNLSNAETNLFYPTPFTRQQSSDAIESVIARSFPKLTAKQGRLSETYAQLLEALVAQLAERNIAFYIAVLPEHPMLRKRKEDGFYEQLLEDLNRLCEKTHVPVFSFISLLDDSQFIDHIHPNPEGAKILTAAMAREVAKWQSPER